MKTLIMTAGLLALIGGVAQAGNLPASIASSKWNLTDRGVDKAHINGN